MTKDSMMQGLVSCIKEQGDVIRWFKKLNRKYEKQKEKGEITEQDLCEISDFLFEVQSQSPDMFDYLESEWDINSATMFADIVNFGDRYNQIQFEKQFDILDDFEKAETESLFYSIWDKNLRTEISCSFYDWEEDQDKVIDFAIPRINRDKCEYNLKYICALMIYNRGSMTVRFFSKRGLFDVALVSAINGSGEWKSIPADQINYYFEDGLRENERGITLQKKSTNIDPPQKNRLLYMPNRKGGQPC